MRHQLCERIIKRRDVYKMSRDEVLPVKLHWSLEQPEPRGCSGQNFKEYKANFDFEWDKTPPAQLIPCKSKLVEYTYTISS